MSGQGSMSEVQDYLPEPPFTQSDEARIAAQAALVDEYERRAQEAAEYAKQAKVTYLEGNARSLVCYVNCDDTGRGIFIEGKESNPGGEDMVRLSPTEALSLLAWLKQEEQELQRLAKEQAG